LTFIEHSFINEFKRSHKEWKMKKAALVAIPAAVIWSLLSINLLQGTVTPKPDLIVNELTISRIASDTIPLRVHIDVRIKNRGNIHTPSVTCLTRLYYRLHSTDPWQTLHDFSSGSLPAGSSTHFSQDFDFTTGGTYTFKAEVDAGQAIAESSESNNTKTATKTFAAGTPDLTVENLTAATVQVLANGNWKVQVEWDVKNIGDGKAQGSFTTVLKVYKDSSVSGADLKSFSRSNLEAGHSLHFSKTTIFTNVHSLSFKVVADSSDKIHEKREDNNSAQTPILTKS
jgi:subtilase family serine protease